MIARVLVQMPFHAVVPEGQEFALWQYEDRGYRVEVYPPLKSGRPSDGVDEVHIDGVRAYEANILRIDFHKESFDRHEGTLADPPYDVIKDAINSFLTRLRYAARASRVRPLDFPMAPWRLMYLNDDGSQLSAAKGLVRGRGALQFSFSWVALNRPVWDSIHELPNDYNPPPWEELLLDAQGDLPRVGPAVVLAATALEVFIARKLDELAVLKGVSEELWKWISKRDDYRQDPTVEEQYDVLLEFFTGHSLKSEAKLWESFKNVKRARNSFVHEGTAKVGNTVVSVEAAGKLVAAAREVISKVREWLPPELHWPVFNHNVEMRLIKRIRQASAAQQETGEAETNA